MKRLLLGGAALLALAAAIPAMAADMPVKALKAPVELPYNWTGFYIGGNVGYSWGRGQTDLLDVSTSTSTVFRGVPPLVPVVGGVTVTSAAGIASGTANMNGFLGGVQAGYNTQFNTFVLGAEVDIQATGQRGSIALFDPTNFVLAAVNDKMPWFATFRGRIGVLPAPRWLLYVTGGGALTEIDQDIAVAAGTLAAVSSTNTTRFGWVIGGGVEAAIERSNWTVKAEFLHMDFGSISTAAVGGSSTTTISNVPLPGFSTVIATSTAAALTTRVTDNVFRVGANYRIAPR
jgi:outer membrane immunogenic protein